MMRETGAINREIEDALSTLGHTDEIIVCDAGFAIPVGVRTIDMSPIFSALRSGHRPLQRPAPRKQIPSSHA